MRSYDEEGATIIRRYGVEPPELQMTKKENSQSGLEPDSTDGETQPGNIGEGGEESSASPSTAENEGKGGEDEAGVGGTRKRGREQNTESQEKKRGGGKSSNGKSKEFNARVPQFRKRMSALFQLYPVKSKLSYEDIQAAGFWSCWRCPIGQPCSCDEPIY
jgi:hypothetical protein